jgi:hypothetical protein
MTFSPGTPAGPVSSPASLLGFSSLQRSGKGGQLTLRLPAAVMSPSRVSHPFRALPPPEPLQVCFTLKRSWDFSLQCFPLVRIRFPLPGSLPSCRCFHPRFFSEEKEAKKVARLQGFAPRSRPFAPGDRSQLRHRGTPGILPLSRFRPCVQMLESYFQHNLHGLFAASLTS